MEHRLGIGALPVCAAACGDVPVPEWMCRRAVQILHISLQMPQPYQETSAFEGHHAEILALQGFPAGLRASYFIRDKSGYSEIQDNQTFSIAGSRKGFGDPRGTLFFELARLAEARKPSYLLFENVPYVQKCIRYIMYTNQICIAPPKNSGARLFLLCSTVHNMFLLAKG